MSEDTDVAEDSAEHPSPVPTDNSAVRMLSRLLNWGGKADRRSEVLSRFLVAPPVSREAFFAPLIDVALGGDAHHRLLDLARDLWPEVLPEELRAGAKPPTRREA